MYAALRVTSHVDYRLVCMYSVYVVEMGMGMRMISVGVGMLENALRKKFPSTSHLELNQQCNNAVGLLQFDYMLAGR